MNPPETLAAPVPDRLCRITCCLDQELTRVVTECLEARGCAELTVEPGRAAVLAMRRSRLPWRSGARLDSRAVDILRAVVPAPAAEATLAAGVAAAGLHEPGRGTIVAETIEGYGFTAPAPPPAQTSPPANPRVARELAVLTCILSSPGAGDTLARLALDLGVCVPVVSMGEGTGMRDRLGLLRITIPPEKELVHLVAPTHDAEGILRVLVEAGRLNQPGRGFAYVRPLILGMLDTRLRVGRQRAAASVEQIIAAIDELRGDTTWRHRYPELGPHRPTGHAALGRDFCELTITSAEGSSAAVSRIAVAAGATGATSAKVRRVLPCGSEVGAAGERTTIVVPTARREAVVAGLLAHALEGSPCAATLAVAAVPVTYSYASLPAAPPTGR